MPVRHRTDQPLTDGAAPPAPGHLRAGSAFIREHQPLGGQLTAGAGRTRIFIHPPHKFRLVDALFTNFHLPCSTLLMLVSAFASPGTSAGIDPLLEVYREAIAERYRFFSYGDAMLIA